MRELTCKGHEVEEKRYHNFIADDDVYLRCKHCHKELGKV
jgi:hypothetical protein